MTESNETANNSTDFLASILWHNHRRLIPSFRSSIAYGFLDTWRRCECQGKTPQEPDFVAGLVTESAPLIYSGLNSVLSPHKISVSVCTVFCHQKPEISFLPPRSGSCELGDILFAYVHMPKSGAPRRNALLFQAKSSSDHPYAIQGKEIPQLILYERWLDFKYKRSSFLNGQVRTVTPKRAHMGAQYLLIDNRPPQEPMSGLLGFPGTYPAGCCAPGNLLVNHSTLAMELFKFFLFDTGRLFDDKRESSKEQGWSQVVWDLLETGVQKSFSRARSGRSPRLRLTGDMLQMLDGAVFARATSRDSCCSTVRDIVGREGVEAIYGGEKDRPPGMREQDGNFEDPGEGVSIVLIETSEREPGRD